MPDLSPTKPCCIVLCRKSQGTEGSRYSCRSQQSIERGKIINFMSADVNNIINFLHPAMADIVVAPITIVVAVVLLYHQIG